MKIQRFANIKKRYAYNDIVQNHLKFSKMGVTELVFELIAVKANVTGIYDKLCYCYGNLLCKKDDHNF